MRRRPCQARGRARPRWLSVGRPTGRTLPTTAARCRCVHPHSSSVDSSPTSLLLSVRSPSVPAVLRERGRPVSSIAWTPTPRPRAGAGRRADALTGCRGAVVAPSPAQGTWTFRGETTRPEGPRRRRWDRPHRPGSLPRPVAVSLVAGTPAIDRRVPPPDGFLGDWGAWPSNVKVRLLNPLWPGIRAPLPGPRASGQCSSSRLLDRRCAGSGPFGRFRTASSRAAAPRE